MNRTRAIIFVGSVLLLVAAFVGGAAWRDRSTEVIVDRAEQAITAIGVEAEPSALNVDDLRLDVDGFSATPVTSGAPARGTWPPLPPLDAAVADVFDDLESRARTGDADAACRLAAELQRCSAARFTQNMANDAERDLARRNLAPEGAIDYIARAQAFSESAGAGCDGLSDQQLASAFDWQRQAAMMNPSLRLGFVLRPSLDRRDFLADLDRWAEYRRLALPWLEAAAREGDPAAVIALARIYGDHRAHVLLAPQFRIRDDERFVQYAELMDRYGVGLDVVRNAAGQARARLAPEALARAEQRADAMFNRDAPVLDAAAVDAAHGNSLRSSLQPESCGQPAS